MTFIKKKLQERKEQPPGEHMSFPKENIAEIIEANRAATEKTIKDQRARERKQHNAQGKVQGQTIRAISNAIRGKAVFVDSAVAFDHSLLHRLSLVKVDKHKDADVFVVNDVTNLGSRVRLAAAIKGAHIMSPGFFNNQGVCVKKWRFAGCPRIVHVSKDCFYW